MCGLIALALLLIGGLFGFTSVSSSATVVEPPLVEVQPVLEMTPTPTPAIAILAVTPVAVEPQIVEVQPAVEVTALPTLSAVEPQIVEVQPATEAAIPEQAISCESVPEAEDVANMLALVSGAFQASIWTEQIGSDTSKTTATWVSDNYGAVAYLEYLHYDCGVPADAIDAYYSPAGFDVLLSNYTSHAQTAKCTAGDLRLFEFAVTFGGVDYLMNYWVEQTSPTRVAGLMLVFPSAQPTKLEGYAARLFPELPNCAAAAAG